MTPVGTSTKVPGTVTRVGTLPDPNAETTAYPVTITVDEPPATLAAGSSATASVVVATAKDVLTVPTSAVNRGTVTVLNGDQTTVTRVTVGAVGPTRTEIKEGLTAGGGPKGVGDAVNHAVVLTFLLLFFTNFVLTAVYFQVVPAKGG